MHLPESRVGDTSETCLQDPANTPETFPPRLAALRPASAPDDIVVQTTVVDRANGDTITSCATTMVVRVELEAVYAAPENPCANRHVYGVGEEVKFKVSPKSASVMLRTTKRDTGDDTGAYELFNGSEEINAAEDRVYTCPISATYTPYIRVTLKGVEYSPSIALVEPQEVITPEASFDGVCWPSGACGEPGLRTVNYIGPMHVSFEGIAVSEVPCTERDIIPPTGHFTNRTSHLFHGPDEGAKYAIWIKPGNYWMIDNACSGGGGVELERGDAVLEDARRLAPEGLFRERVAQGRRPRLRAVRKKRFSSAPHRRSQGPLYAETDDPGGWNVP